MRKLAFVATPVLPEYHNPVLSFQAGEVKDVPVDMADYLQDTFPENFTEPEEANENGLKGTQTDGEGQDPSDGGDSQEDVEPASGDQVFLTEEEEPVAHVEAIEPAEELEDDSLGKSEPTVEEVKTSANNTAPKRTNQRKRGSGVPKTKLFGK